MTRRIRSAADLWVGCFSRHDILDHASAIALRALVALIPLTLLGLALLGAFGLEDVWHKQLAPPLEHHLTHTTFRAINAGALRIFHQSSAGLIFFAGLLSIWNVSSVVRACMGGLDAIYEHGLRVPDDVAIVGAGDVAYSDLIRVPLSTVRWSKSDVGRSAAALILDQIEGSKKARPRRVIVPPELVVRASA